MSLRRYRISLPLVAAVLISSLAPSAAQGQRARQGLLTLDDARLFYEVVGTGDPVIVVHGGPGLDHSYLQPGLNVLARGNTLVYYDQRGTGRSSTELTPDVIDIDAFVEDIDALRQALGYERFHLLGHSFGARIALEYAARHPESLRTLLLINPVEPGSRYEEEIEERRQRAQTEEDSTELATLTAGEAFAARDPATVSEVYRVVFRQSLRDRERIRDLDLALAQPTAKNGQEVARLLGASMEAIDGWARLQDVEVPTLVVHGRYDTIPLAMSQELARELPLGRFALLESGHFAYLEDPDGLLSAVSAFFVDISR